MLNNITEIKGETLFSVLYDVFLMETKDIVKFLDKLFISIEPNNALVILCFLHFYFENKSNAIDELSDEVMEMLHNIIDKLKKIVPNEFSHFIPDLKPKLQDDSMEKKNDFFENLEKIIKEVLIKTSTVEFVNAINAKLDDETEVGASKEYNISSVFIFYIENLEFSKKKNIFKYIIPLLNEESISDLLFYFLQNTKYSELFFVFLKYYNPLIYEKAVELIYSEKKFFKANLLKALPEIHSEKIIANIRDYNWEIAESIINTRPDLTGEIAKCFAENKLKVSRNFFLEKIISQDNYFSYYIEDMALSPEELLELCNNSKMFLENYFIIINQEDQMVELCKIICKEGNNYVLEFIKNIASHGNIELFLKALTQTMRFTNDLKEYILNNFAKKREYFHILITYLELKEIELLLNEYYQPELSIEGLLRKLHPQELLLEIQMFSCEELALKLLEECLESSKFVSRDWIFLLKSNELYISQIKIRTTRLLLQKKPELKEQILIFLNSCIAKRPWRSKKKFDEFVKCLELLAADAINLLELMKKEDIKTFYKKSSKVRKIIRKYFENYTGNNLELKKIFKKILNKQNQ